MTCEKVGFVHLTIRLLGVVPPVTSHELQNTVSNTSDIVYNFYPFMLVAVIYVCLNKRANRPLHAVCTKFGDVTDIKANLPNLSNLNWVLNSSSKVGKKEFSA